MLGLLGLKSYRKSLSDSGHSPGCLPGFEKKLEVKRLRDGENLKIQLVSSNFEFFFSVLPWKLGVVLSFFS